MFVTCMKNPGGGARPPAADAHALIHEVPNSNELCLDHHSSGMMIIMN